MYITDTVHLVGIKKVFDNKYGLRVVSMFLTPKSLQQKINTLNYLFVHEILHREALVSLPRSKYE